MSTLATASLLCDLHEASPRRRVSTPSNGRQRHANATLFDTNGGLGEGAGGNDPTKLTGVVVRFREGGRHAVVVVAVGVVVGAR